MRKYVKIFLCVFLFFLAFSFCRNNKNENTEITFGSSQVDSYVMQATESQIDSICKVDSLPCMYKWKKVSFTDFETKKTYEKYIYIDNDASYVISFSNNSYKVEKRDK